MARRYKIILRLGTIALGLLVGFSVYEAIILLPVVSYAVSSPNSERECAAIKPGMSRSEVLDLIRKGAPPLSEYMEGSTIVLSRASNACTVEFDPDKNIVIRSKLDPNRRMGTTGEEYLSQ
jgi:hypothetical protein